MSAIGTCPAANWRIDFQNMSAKKIPRYLLSKIRQICLALPETKEIETWDHPTFRVNGKIFAGIGHGEETIGKESIEVTSATCKAKDKQEQLLKIGDPFFYPKYVGAKGWIGIVLSRNSDWKMIKELITESWKKTAPKKLVSQFETEQMGQKT